MFFNNLNILTSLTSEMNFQFQKQEKNDIELCLERIEGSLLVQSCISSNTAG